MPGKQADTGHIANTKPWYEILWEKVVRVMNGTWGPEDLAVAEGLLILSLSVLCFAVFRI